MREIIAAILAGAVGTLANAAAAALLISPEKFGQLASAPGRYGVAIALSLTLPLLAQITQGVPFAILGFILLTGGASLLAKLVFGSGAAWPMVLSLNAVYAVAALVTYGLIARWPGR